MTSIVLACVQLAIIVFICTIEYRIASPIIFMWATLLLIFGVPHLITVIIGDDEYKTWVLDYASIFVIFFSSIYLIVCVALYTANGRIRILFGARFISNNSSGINKTNTSSIFADENYGILYEKKFISLCMIFLILRLIFTIYSISTVTTILDSSKQTMYLIASKRSYVSIDTVVDYLGNIGTTALVVLLLRKKYNLFLVFCILVFFTAILTRSRSSVVPIIVTSITYLLIFKRQYGIRMLFILLVITIVTVYIIEGLRVFRFYGSIGYFIKNFSISDFNSRILNHIIMDNSEFALRRAFYFFIENNNNFPGFGEGHTYLRMLLVLIPERFSLGIKPPEFCIAMGAAYLPGSIGYSITPTLFGDCYANLGFSGILLGVFWAIFGYYCKKLTDYLFIKGNTLMGSCSFVLISYTCVLIGRGTAYNPFANLIRCLLLIYIIHAIIKTLSRSNQRISKIAADALSNK